jgi:hypothetical protein
MVDTSSEAIKSRCEELLETVKIASPGSENHDKALAELHWQQTLLQLQANDIELRAADAQERAALASERAALASERAADASIKNLKYVLASVIVSGLAALASAASAYYTWYPIAHPK